MVAQIINGNDIARQIREELRLEIAEIKAKYGVGIEANRFSGGLL